MHQEADRRFLDEARRFQLQATCDRCVYFETQTASCSEGYPNHEHLALGAAPGDTICFCKRFELW
jgi:hypothetical protein